MGFKRKVTMSSVVWLAGRQLASMLRSGLPLSHSLSMIAKDIERGEEAGILGDLSRSVEEGESLSEALARHPRLKPDEVRAMVKAGEQSGRLPDALEEAVRYADRLHDFREKVRTMSAYPVFLLFMAVIPMLAMFRVLPFLEELLKGLGLGASVPTRILLFFVHRPALFALLLAVVAACLILALVGRHRFILWLGRKLPLLKSFFAANERARFLRAASICLKAGMTVPEALQSAVATAGDPAFRENLRDVIARVNEGGTIGESLEGEQALPRSVVWVLKHAERHGELPACLDQLADTFDRRADLMGRAALALIEPAAITVIGIGIGIYIIGLFSPIFDMVGAIQP